MEKRRIFQKRVSGVACKSDTIFTRILLSCQNLYITYNKKYMFIK